MRLRLYSSISHQRVDTQINKLREELDALYGDDGAGELTEFKKHLFQQIQKKISKADKALQDGKTELAWQLCHSAKRSQLKLDSREVLIFKQRALYLEANEKLKGWRKEVIQDMVKADSNTKNEDTPIDTDILIEAYKILHEHFSNVYIKNKHMLSQLIKLSITSIIALILFVITLQKTQSPLDNSMEAENGITFLMVCSVLLFGIMGACISGIFSLASGTSTANIPKQLVNSWITMTRPVVGAISALVLFIFFRADIFLTAIELNNAAILAVSFVAGFSERLVIRAVSSVTNQSKFEFGANSSKS